MHVSITRKPADEYSDYYAARSTWDVMLQKMMELTNTGKDECTTEPRTHRLKGIIVRTVPVK